jgi:hypothetical protein
LKIEGRANVNFQVDSLHLSHPFYVIKEMHRNVIIGRDWLIQNGVRVYYDLGSFRIEKTYSPLEEDIHIPSVVQAQRKCVIKQRMFVLVN